MSTSSDFTDFWHLNIPNVKRAIVGFSDLQTRSRLSQCSRADHTLVESTPVRMREMHIFIEHFANPHRVRLTLAGTSQTFKFQKTALLIRFLLRFFTPPNSCAMLRIHNSNPNNTQQLVLSQLTHQLTVQNITPVIRVVHWASSPGHHFYNLFTKLNAQRLEGCLVHSKEESRENIVRILETEQWKTLKVVEVYGCMDSFWSIDDVLDKPKFIIHLKSLEPKEIREAIKKLQSYNHPLDSCFFISFWNSTEMCEIYRNHNELVENSESSYYLKSFPMPNEGCELRVQFFRNSSGLIGSISGMVAPKNQLVELSGIRSKIESCLCARDWHCAHKPSYPYCSLFPLNLYHQFDL